jgi:hypothetical protein
LNGKEKLIKNNDMRYKAKSITSKASSACKINMGLVMGEADVQNSKSFVDYSSLMAKKMKAGGGKTSSTAVEIDNSENNTDDNSENNTDDNSENNTDDNTSNINNN